MQLSFSPTYDHFDRCSRLNATLENDKQKLKISKETFWGSKVKFCDFSCF